MSGPERAEAGPPDPEALRRALYSPGATQQDLERFEAAAGAPAAARADAEPVPQAAPATDASRADGPQPATSPAAAPPRAPRRRRTLVLAAAGGAVLVAALAVGTAVLQQDRGPEQLPPVTVRISEQDRAELLGNLRDVGAAGISAYLVTHPSPPGLGTVTRVSTVEVHGVGGGTAVLSPPDLGGQAGRATVLVTTAEAGPVSWTASRLRTSGSPVVRLAPITARGGEQAAGDLTTTTFRYGPGRRPVRLDVDVPAGVRWGAAVVYTD